MASCESSDFHNIFGISTIEDFDKIKEEPNDNHAKAYYCILKFARKYHFSENDLIKFIITTNETSEIFLNKGDVDSPQIIGKYLEKILKKIPQEELKRIKGTEKAVKYYLFMRQIVLNGFNLKRIMNKKILNWLNENLTTPLISDLLCDKFEIILNCHK